MSARAHSTDAAPATPTRPRVTKKKVKVPAAVRKGTVGADKKAAATTPATTTPATTTPATTTTPAATTDTAAATKQPAG